MVGETSKFDEPIRQHKKLTQQDINKNIMNMFGGYSGTNKQNN